ncbi:MAG: thioredoxin domain-containing protein [Solirubrobacteraceae bacterium]
MPNALARESSPYLRQHAQNPVDWLPWGPDAFARARERNAPLLVSIGYSSCHWCHVMERESFEDERTAQVMNESFVCVKVDREERPDVDALYMEAVQGMTGHGGWPLNVFLTPDGLPFYGGTYFPPAERPGMPAFTQVLQAVAEAWEQRGEEISAAGEQLREQLSGAARLTPSEQPIDPGSLERAVEEMGNAFDAVHGGFGAAPKFPQASAIEFLLLQGERGERMALYTLRSMASGGIHDQVGGGFHRYSVDANWTVPHFEKMLYDNALLARAYLHGFQLSGEERLGEVCRDTLDWALREMRGPEGAFYSALDADSEGVEGRYYVWTVAELREVLGEDSEQAIAWFGASEQGNFQDPHYPQPGLNVLEDRGVRPQEQTRAHICERLAAARERRTRPGVDDKRLTSWNALMISALADAGAVLAEPRYTDAAVRCADFVLGKLHDQQGRLLRTYSNGEAKIGAFLEDHAFLLEALIVLFEATCEERWLNEATVLAESLLARFSDEQRGAFFSTASDGEALIVRRKELEDSPIPSGNSSAAMGLLRLSQLTGEERYAHAAAGTIALLHEIAPRHPTAFGHLLQAIHWQLAPMRPIACELPAQRIDR